MASTLTPERLRVVTSGTTGVGIRFHAEPNDPAPDDGSGLMSTMPEKRRIEFAMGRSAARDALADLGASVTPIPIGASGEPIWPHGVVGSISHTRGLAIAIAGWRQEFRGIGVDVEPLSRRVSDRTFRRICTPVEMEWVDIGTDPRRALMIFCSKEATYKALSAFGGAGLGFQDVEFAPEASGGLAGRIKDGVAPEAPRRFDARTLVAGGFVVACVLVPSSDPPIADEVAGPA